MDEFLPQIAIEVVEDVPLPPQAIFGEEKSAYWLEIGTGGGEHIAGQAEKNPDIGCIASEVFENGISSLLQHIKHKNLQNVRIYPQDVRFLLKVLPEHSLDRVFVLFPDPWPKSRHHKRRLISQEMLDMLARVIKPGGSLRIATDHVDYSQWILVQMQQRADFVWQARAAKDWLNAPKDHIPTRYQQKAKDVGRNSLYLDYKIL
jgi:tRNA (guanine-N7-)-methyltransferase